MVTAAVEPQDSQLNIARWLPGNTCEPTYVAALNTSGLLHEQYFKLPSESA